MKFGWLTLAHSPSPQDDARSIFEQLEQAQLAEQVGFDGVWLAEIMLPCDGLVGQR